MNTSNNRIGRLSVYKLGLTFGIFALMAGDSAKAAPELTLLNDMVLDQSAFLMPEGARFGRALNGVSFQQEPFLTCNGYQYAIWYHYTSGSEQDVYIARRNVNGTTWESFDTTRNFVNGQSDWDAHNVISLGISGDGRLHVAYDHHNQTLKYFRSVPGVANNPGSIPWNNGSVFPDGDQSHLISGQTITDLTYPRFASGPGGDLAMTYRRGGSGNGKVWLSTYSQSSGTWSTPQVIISGTGTYSDALGSSSSRNGYLNGLDFDSAGNLHITWTWREDAGGSANHDILYAYRDSGGTWRNNAGGALTLPLTVDSSGILIRTLDRRESLYNQQAQAVDPQGGVHAMMWHRRSDDPQYAYQSGDRFQPEDSAYFHYFRNTSGDWNASSPRQLPDQGVGSRPKIAFDNSGNVFAVYVSPGPGNTDRWAPGDLVVAHATEGNSYNDWSIIHVDSRNFIGEPHIDQDRLLNDGVVSIFIQEDSSSTGTTGSPLHVIEFSVGPGGGGGGGGVINLAEEYGTISGSSGDDGNVPENAIDGIDDDDSNRWSAPGPFPSWIEVDLGEDRTFSGTELHGYLNRDYQFKVEAKPTGGSYQLIVDETANTDPTPIANMFAPVTARYVRLTVTGADSYTGTWTAIREFKILSDQAAVAPYASDANTLALYHFDEAAAGSDPGNPIVNIGNGGTALDLTSTGGPDGRDNSGAGGYGATAPTGFGSAFDVLGSGNGSYHSATSSVGGGALTAGNVLQSALQSDSGAFTYEGILRLGGTGVEQTILSHDGDSTRGFLFRVIDGKLGFYTGSTNVEAAIPTWGVHAFVADKWFHVAVTYTGSQGAADNLRFYWTALDSTATEANPIGTGTLSADLSGSVANRLGIGTTTRSPFRFECGVVDEIRISQVARGAGDFLFGLSPLQAWRLENFGTIDPVGDAADDANPDGDAMDNLGEFRAGTDPSDPASVLRVDSIEPVGNDIVIQFPSVIGRTYRVERSDTLEADSWQIVDEGIAGTGETISVADAGGAGGAKWFYRIVVEESAASA